MWGVTAKNVFIHVHCIYVRILILDLILLLYFGIGNGLINPVSFRWNQIDNIKTGNFGIFPWQMTSTMNCFSKLVSLFSQLIYKLKQMFCFQEQTVFKFLKSDFPPFYSSWVFCVCFTGWRNMSELENLLEDGLRSELMLQQQLKALSEALRKQLQETESRQREELERRIHQNTHLSIDQKTSDQNEVNHQAK